MKLIQEIEKNKNGEKPASPKDALTDLKSEKKALNSTLSSIDEDYNSGKISKKAYQNIQTKYKKRYTIVEEKIKELEDNH